MAQPTRTLALSKSHRTGTDPEEGQGETPNCLTLFHTPTGMKSKIDKIHLRSRDKKNVSGLAQLRGPLPSLPHVRGQLRGAME